MFNLIAIIFFMRELWRGISNSWQDQGRNDSHRIWSIKQRFYIL